MERVIDENDPKLMFYARDDGDGRWAARYRENAHETFDTLPQRFRSEGSALRAAEEAHWAVSD